MELGRVTLGLREGVIALIALVTVYMVFVLWRMRRLRQRPPEIPPAQPQAVEPAFSQTASPAEPAPSPEIRYAWEKPPTGMADHVLQAGLESELAQLREELDAVRGELAALRNDMRQELAHLRASQTVSPIYGDAMQMAAAGYDPAAIAERCGIARAEAELVAALARRQEH